MADALKTVRVIANANDPNLPVVNIVTSTAAYKPNEIPTWLQAAGVATHNLYPTVQVASPAVVGLPTVFIAGYSAPA